MINGAYIEAMNGNVFGFVQSQIQEANIPPSQVGLVQDRLFLSWMRMQSDMIIDMLNTAMSLIQSCKENDESKMRNV